LIELALLGPGAAARSSRPSRSACASGGGASIAGGATIHSSNATDTVVTSRCIDMAARIRTGAVDSNHLHTAAAQQRREREDDDQAHTDHDTPPRSERGNLRLMGRGCNPEAALHA
jgi:hypothetical protein